MPSASTWLHVPGREVARDRERVDAREVRAAREPLDRAAVELEERELDDRKVIEDPAGLGLERIHAEVHLADERAPVLDVLDDLEEAVLLRGAARGQRGAVLGEPPLLVGARHGLLARELDPDPLAARIAALEQPVDVHQHRGVVVGRVDDRAQELRLGRRHGRSVARAGGRLARFTGARRRGG